MSGISRSEPGSQGLRPLAEPRYRFMRAYRTDLSNGSIPVCEKTRLEITRLIIDPFDNRPVCEKIRLEISSRVVGFVQGATPLQFD